MIQFENVSKSYNGATPYALDDVSFKIKNGEFVFIIGQSGSGKSTMIKLISCEEYPTEGTVWIDALNIHNIPRRKIPNLRRSMGMIFQDFRLINTKTVYDNVAFAMDITGASRQQIARRVPLVLSIVGLKDKMKARPNELSGGEQQRVAIARAIVNNPRLVLADEPTGNLDPENSEAIMVILNEIQKNGTTIIVCTHDLSVVEKMNKRTIRFQDGHVVEDRAATRLQ